MTQKLILSVSAIALGSMLFVAPAHAGDACDLGGVVQLATAGTDSLLCGTNGANSAFTNRQTMLGERVAVNGEDSTAVGAVSTAYAAGTSRNNYAPPLTFSATAIGSYSVAAGTGSVAVGDQAVVGVLADQGGNFFNITAVNNGTAIGSSSLVTGTNGTSVGADSRALAANGTALGYQADAFAAGATAIGTQARGNTADATAVGFLSGGTGIQSTAIGARSDALGSNSVTLGWDANATATAAIAIGASANASAVNSGAIGQGATATHANSVALGNGTATTAINQVHVGGRTIGGVNAGVALTDAVNVSQLNAATAGIAADISGLEAMDAILANRIDDVDDRSSSGSAVAIAMGGAAFLPDKPFNISGNLGFYRGAWAGAMNINALISPNAAINAGLGAGFNKKGKVGGRVGFTYGF